MRILTLYQMLKPQIKLYEANLKNLYTKSISETPRMAARGKQMTGDVRYFGLSKDGTINFKIKSQTRGGRYHYVAIDCPDIIRFGEVVENGDHFNVSDLMKLLTMNGFRIHCGCFTAGHKVITDKGEVNIEDIKIGDKVLTHKGNYREVYDTVKYTYKGKLIRINGNITCTPEHKIFVKDKDGTCRWVEAQDLTTSYELVTPLEPIGYIYKTTDLKNGKIYIGQRRSPEFCDWYHGSGKIVANIDKKDPERLKTELIEFCVSSELLDEREKYWIKECDSTNRKIGYNISEGGNTSVSALGSRWINNGIITKRVKSNDLDDYLSNGWELGYTKDDSKRNSHPGWKHSKETKDLISRQQRGKVVSDITKKKISKAHKAIDHPQFRKPKSEETKRKMSETAEKRWRDSKGHFTGGDINE